VAVGIEPDDPPILGGGVEAAVAVSRDGFGGVLAGSLDCFKIGELGIAREDANIPRAVGRFPRDGIDRDGPEGEVGGERRTGS
jgi:hypothetical protein